MLKLFKALLVCSLLAGIAFMGARIVDGTDFQGADIKRVATALKAVLSDVVDSVKRARLSSDQQGLQPARIQGLRVRVADHSSSEAPSPGNGGGPKAQAHADVILNQPDAEDRALTRDVLESADNYVHEAIDMNASDVSTQGAAEELPEKIIPAPCDPKRMGHIRKIYADTLKELEWIK